MSATTLGGLIGAAIEEINGGKNEAEGALIGAVTATVIKAVAPVIVTYAVGWAVIRAAEQLRAKAFGTTVEQ